MTMKKFLLCTLFMVLLISTIHGQNKRSIKTISEFNIEAVFEGSTFKGADSESELIAKKGSHFEKMWTMEKKKLTEAMVENLNSNLKRTTYAQVFPGNDSCYYKISVYVTNLDPDGEVTADVFVARQDIEEDPILHRTINCNGGTSSNYLGISTSGFSKLGRNIAYFLSNNLRQR